jgi:hypothetical protein
MEITKFAGKQPEPYREHAIILTEKFQFAVVFEDEQYPTYCASLQETHDKIDAYLKRKAKQNKAKETCKLPFVAIGLDYELRTGIVKGFHATQGHVLATPSLGDTSSWYPDTPMLRDRLKRLAALKAEAADIERNLRAFRMAAKPVYGRTSAENYDAALDNIVKEYEKKRALAEDTAKSMLAVAV